MLACFRRLIKIPQLLNHPPSSCTNVIRTLSSTQRLSGFEEFFPPGVYEGDNLVEEKPVIGRSWMKDDLRIKSNSDLHKLWYILLKERNMILTMRHECKRLGIPMPGPQRYGMVLASMRNLQAIIDERNNAIMELEKERWYKFDEQLEAEKEAPYYRKNIETIEQQTETNDVEEIETNEKKALMA